MNKAERLSHQIERMDSTLAKGPRNFTLKYGVLGLGPPGALAWSLWMSYSQDAPFWILFPGAMFLFSAVGYAWGILMWSFMLRKRVELLNSLRELGVEHPGVAPGVDEPSSVG